MTKPDWQLIDIRLCAVAASLLVSLYTILLPELPNVDAYRYIKTAEIFQEQGFGAAIDHYTWAGYSILIALVSESGLSLFTAAYVVNALFFALLVYSFVSIVKLMDDSRLVLWLAAVTVLCYPELNEFRYFIIRDVGFWALSLFALWQLILYCQNPRWQTAAIFCAVLILASVFRAEALLYMGLTPFALLFGGDKEQRLKQFLQFAAIVLTAIVLTALALFALNVNLFSLLANFISVYQPFVMETFSPDIDRNEALGQLLFGSHGAAFSQQYLTAFIAAGLLVIFCMTIFYGISGAYFWLLVYGAWRKYLHLGSKVALPIISYMVINALILFIFLYITRFLTSRYAMVFCLMLSLQVPIIAGSIIRASRTKDASWHASIILTLFFTYSAFDSYITFGKPKDFLTNSADYIAGQTTTESSLLTNNRTIAYYSGRVDNYDQIPRIITAEELLDVEPGGLVALEMFYEMAQLVQQDSVRPFLQLETAYPSIDDQRVAIFRRVSP